MSKKFFIIIISTILILLLVSLVGYYFLLQNNNGSGGGVVSTFKNFFPFGGESASTTVPFEDLPVEDTPKENVDYTKKLRLLSADPVAGMGLLDLKSGTVVRYIEIATGHIFEIELFSPNKNRISNTTIPTVYEASWGNKGLLLVTQYLKDDNQTVDTYGLTLKNVSTSTESNISAVRFAENIKSVSTNENSVFSLELKNSNSVGYISGFDGSKKTEVWNSPVKELLSQYVNSKTIALTTKPHQDSEGFMFFVDTTTGRSKKVIGGIFGLSTITSPSATQVLFLNQRSTPELFIFKTKDKSSVAITPTTLPEKCVWSKKDETIVYCAVPQEFIQRDSLTSWYGGQISFTDNIWRYDLKNNTSFMVGRLFNESDQQIDVIKPALSENEQYLVFINKIDNSLWSLDLTK